MKGFLKNTAEQILNEHQQLQQLRIVLPNRRAGLFFTQHLGQLISKPTWMPEVVTIEELFYGFAKQRPADNLTLIFELYKVYQSLHPSPESFDKFYYWGEMILKDFNDIDQFMADAKRLYHHLSEVKELSSDLSFLSEEQVALIQQFWKSFELQDAFQKEKFLRFWEMLSVLYESYQVHLQVAGLAYSGQLYKKVVEGLSVINVPEKHYIFVGFNAFTATEERLIKHFVSEFGAEIYWDFDAYYMDDLNQEAGLFFRAYAKDPVFQKTFPKEIPTKIQRENIQITTYATPLKSNQANLVGSILENVTNTQAWENTVIILPDEQMLFPVLHSLPEQVDKVNVTMGYPVKNTPVYAFIEAILELQRYIKIEEGLLSVYHRPLKDILSLIYLKSENDGFCKEVLKVIQEENKIYYPIEKLKKGGPFFELIFQKVEAKDLFGYLTDLIEALVDRLPEEGLQQSYLFQCYKQLNRLRDIFQSQEAVDVELEFFIKLFRQLFREVKLPFEGEPLQGLQLMGVLESRNLDFERVIICNMNEDSFPPAASLNSMIPFNLRKAFGLPVQEQNDAIYAYTFYRLLHHADEVHMIYTTSSDQGKAGEKSRYIQQMQVEMNLEEAEEVVYLPVDLHPSKEIIIEKNDDILKILEQYKVASDGTSLRYFSPSSLSVYLDCRLKFYFQYIAKVKEKEEVKEEIDAGVFGNLAHYSMEHLYGGFISRKGRYVVERDDFEDLSMNWIYPAIEKGIRQYYMLEENANTKLSGQMAIVRDVLQKYIEKLLEIDRNDAPFRIISMEQPHQADFRIVTADGLVKVKLQGIIDRVDLRNGVIRLIDYKSGADKKEFKDIASLFDRDYTNRNKAAMQTLYYGLLYQASFPSNLQPLKPALFNFKEIFRDNFSPYLKERPDPKGALQEVEDYRFYKDDYEFALKATLEELYDLNTPFDQTDNLNKCKYCPYIALCSRG
ncbi:PD-(D/E)XK nuclease family protein [Belliella kenyensis]|uniref:PD-(D/E)XK nuclease family protein n=1 Tax=Belliella kenyensis TaxID=1472724 RepID=A0ABV8EQ56_9BACT|nr:PD-(D/E)XK nuclease family protein [Belliella kenyensis]MCH7402164.1 PD-(D/E)XK nuclease family protein [Belliella kenyensis]MDN3601679.1 PD-(D/E)XK nuclease family protein [Belliella kenyensis]